MLLRTMVCVAQGWGAAGSVERLSCFMLCELKQYADEVFFQYSLHSASLRVIKLDIKAVKSDAAFSSRVARIQSISRLLGNI